jgi:hypothetical protein
MPSARPKATTLSSAIGLVLLLFCATLIPAAINVPIEPREDLYQLAESSLKRDLNGAQPQKAQIEQRYQHWLGDEWIKWARSVAFLMTSLIAVVLTITRPRWGLWLVLALCAYVVYIAGPPLVQLSRSSGFLNTSSIVLFSGMRYHGALNGVLLFWHIVIAPFAYALLAVAALACLFTNRRKDGGHESNSTPHADARSSVVLDQPPSARAGGRGRYAAESRAP